jgi:hypothetical protein
MTVCTDFTKFAVPVRERFAQMSQHELYNTDCGDALFDAYLKSFPEGTNPLFRQRTVHDCNCCKHFIRRLGRTVYHEGGR